MAEPYTEDPRRLAWDGDRHVHVEIGEDADGNETRRQVITLDGGDTWVYRDLSEEGHDLSHRDRYDNPQVENTVFEDLQVNITSGANQ